MTNPIQSIVEATTKPFIALTAPLVKAGGRAFTMPGSSPASAPTINLPDPTTTIPAKIPSSKPGGARRGFQDSFLSGVVSGAASQGLTGGGGSGWWGGGGGARGGKSLIGQ